MEGRFRSKWGMVTRFSNEILAVQDFVLFSIESTTSANMTVLRR